MKGKGELSGDEGEIFDLDVTYIVIHTILRVVKVTFNILLQIRVQCQMMNDEIVIELSLLWSLLVRDDFLILWFFLSVNGELILFFTF